MTPTEKRRRTIAKNERDAKRLADHKAWMASPEGKEAMRRYRHAASGYPWKEITEDCIYGSPRRKDAR